MGTDRLNSLLTTTHREFLEQEATVEGGDARSRTIRSRIRQRIRSGLEDYNYLADPDTFDKRDIEQIVDAQVEDDLVEMVAFAYRLAPQSIEAIIQRGLDRGVERIHPEYFVDDVVINIMRRDQTLAEARQRMARDEALTDKQIRILLERGDYPADEIRDYVRSHPTQHADKWARRYR